MTELINMAAPVAELAGLVDKPLETAGQAVSSSDEFSSLLQGLVAAPTDAQTFKQSGRHLATGASVDEAGVLALKSHDPAGADPAADAALPQRRMSELEFLFHRHAGKPFVMLDTQSTQQVTPALQPLASAENPRLANILAMLLPDGEPLQGAVAGSSAAPVEDLPTLPMPWLRPGLSPTPRAREHSTAQLKAPDPKIAGGPEPRRPDALQRAALSPTGNSASASRAMTAEQWQQDMTRAAPGATGPRNLSDMGFRPGNTDTQVPVLRRVGTAGTVSPALTLTGGITLPQQISAPAALPPVPLSPASAQVAEQLVWMAQTGQNSAQVRLHPEELGVVNIRISLEGGNARIAIEASHPDMIQELTSSAPRLRNLLAHEGLGLNLLEIDQRSASQQGGQQNGQFAGQQPGQFDERSRQSGATSEHSGSSGSDAGPEQEGEELPGPALLASQASLRLLDLFA